MNGPWPSQSCCTGSGIRLHCRANTVVEYAFTKSSRAGYELHSFIRFLSLHIIHREGTPPLPSFWASMAVKNHWGMMLYLQLVVTLQYTYCCTLGNRKMWQMVPPRFPDVTLICFDTISPISSCMDAQSIRRGYGGMLRVWENTIAHRRVKLPEVRPIGKIAEYRGGLLRCAQEE